MVTLPSWFTEEQCLPGVGGGDGQSGALSLWRNKAGEGAEARAASAPPERRDESWGLSGRLKSAGKSHWLTSLSPSFIPPTLRKERGQYVNWGSAAAFTPHRISSRSWGTLVSSPGLGVPMY